MKNEPNSPIRHGRLRNLLGRIRAKLKPPTSGREALLGMTSQEEQEYFATCVEELANVDGAIVDLGCWMCSTSISLARGIGAGNSKLKAPTDVVYAIDSFVWESWMDRYLPRVDKDYLPGDSFLPEAERRVAHVGRQIALVEADLTQYSWGNQPIKVLLVDAMKSYDLSRAIALNFFPAMKIGGVLIHQDFKHFYTPWIHILQYRLREFFRFKHEVDLGATVSFEAVDNIPKFIVDQASNFESISDDEVTSSMQYSMGLVSSAGKSAIAAAHAMFFVHQGKPHSARKVLESYRDFHFKDQRELNSVKSALEKVCGDD